MQLSEKQREKAYNPCIVKLQQQNKQCLLYGECGIGKTLISCSIAKDVFNTGPVVLIMENMYFTEWKRTLLELYGESFFSEIDLKLPSTYLSGNCLTLNTSVKNKLGLEFIQTALIRLSQQAFTRPLYVFLDTNMIMAKLPAHKVSFDDKHYGREYTDFFVHIMPLLVPFCINAKLLILDECDKMRGNTDMHFRKTFLDIIESYFIPNEIPTLIVTGTPFSSGQVAEAQNVAEFMGWNFTHSNALRYLQDHMVVCKKIDVNDENFPPLAVSLVNIDSAASWGMPDNMKIFVRMYVGMLDFSEGGTIGGYDEKNYYSDNVFIATLMGILSCLEKQQQILITAERIKFCNVLAFLVELIFNQVTDDRLNTIVPENLHHYFEKGDDGNYSFKHKFVGDLNSQVNIFVHNSEVWDSWNGTTSHSVSDEYLVESRAKLNSGEIQVYIQGLQCGAKNWSAVPTNQEKYIPHLFPHGASYMNVMLVQAISRTNRFNAHGVCNVVLFSRSSKEDLKKNFFQLQTKETDKRSILSDSKAEMDSSLDAKWIEEHFQPATYDAFEQVIHNRQKKFVCVSGIIPLPNLSINMVL